MCDQVSNMEEVVEFGNQEEEAYNSDCGFGSLSPFRSSSPGSRSWYAYACAEVFEHPIYYSQNNLADTSSSNVLMNNVDISTPSPPRLEIADTQPVIRFLLDACENYISYLQGQMRVMEKLIMPLRLASSDGPRSTCMRLDAKSPLHTVQNRGDCALPVSFQQRSIKEDVNLKRKVDTGPSGQDLTIFELGNKQNTNKKSKKTWRIGASVSLEDLKEQFGKKHEEAAESLNVSISTFKRICRELGISRWPSTKIKRERLLLSSLSCNETDRVAANTQMRITKGLTALASNFSVKSNQQKSRSLNLSVNNENGTSLNGNLLGKNEDSDRENIMIQVEDSANQELLYVPQEFGPACDSLVPAYSFADVPTILSRLPQERMPAKDDTQLISSAPSQQRERIARQIEMTDELSQLEKQHLGRERFNHNTGKDIILSVEDSSSYDSGNASEPVQGHDIVDSTHMEVQPLLESIATQPLNSFSCNENTAKNTKLLFNNLIALPLKDLIDPENETSMTKALSILEDNLSLFSEEQAEKILELSVYFPTLVHSWREFSRSQMYNQKSLAEVEKIRDLVETSMRDEESLNARYEELERKEQELMAQLEEVQKEKAGIAEQRNEKSKQTKHLVSLAEDKAASRTKEKHMMKIATTKLNNLVDQWAKIQYFFI